MILARARFQAERGSAQEIVDSFNAQTEQVNDQFPLFKHNLSLTDHRGPFDTAVDLVEVKSLDVHFVAPNAIFVSPEF